MKPPKTTEAILKDDSISTDEKIEQLYQLKNGLQKTRDSTKEHLIREACQDEINCIYDNIRDLNKEKESLNGSRQLSIDEKITLWIDKNIPNSPNKDTYLEAFKIVCKQPDPKNVSTQNLLDCIHKTYTPDLTDEMLRKRIPEFVNSLPL